MIHVHQASIGHGHPIGKHYNYGLMTSNGSMAINYSLTMGFVYPLSMDVLISTSVVGCFYMAMFDPPHPLANLVRYVIVAVCCQ